jgi:hypothetical protein
VDAAVKNQHVSGLKCVGPDFELLVARGIALEGKISNVAARVVDTLTVTPASRTAEGASGDALFIVSLRPGLVMCNADASYSRCAKFEKAMGIRAPRRVDGWANLPACVSSVTGWLRRRSQL